MYLLKWEPIPLLINQITFLNEDQAWLIKGIVHIDSESELTWISNPESHISYKYDWSLLYALNSANKGILSRIIDAFKTSHIDKDVKFWMGSFIEIFLWGNNPYLQLFFAWKDMYKYVI